ncbi:acyloxyacyl hydrolase [Pedobacter sp. SL55]|uniref:acyloxyacyl hydrolase n=1 Tax=Pedobacter sp. SL55 TaxID=2995161 RepID=UPI00226F3457|nr:acyloxyacyl hydrolase [Pedobacter sp. SL55]WAC42535.1 acyloxyacyl hydrolase [Pedobacter sp. SL55]
MFNLNTATIKLNLFLALIIGAFAANAQQNAHTLEFNLQKAINSFSANQNKLQGNAYGGELIFHYNVNREAKRWSSDLGIKSIDVVFNYKRMHNITRVAAPMKGEFGDSYGLLGGLTFPLANISKAELEFTPAFGILYAGESWFSNQNPVVGSKLNFGLKAGLKLNVPLNEKTAVAANLDVLHYSNGGTRVPNNGLNVVSVGLSVARALNENITASKPNFEKEVYQKHTFDLGINTGRRGVYQSRDGLWRTGLYGGYNYRFTSYLAFGAGVDAVYYHTIYDANRNLETYQSKASSFDRWRVGAAIGPDLWMGNLAFMAKYGYYIHYNSLLPIKTYWTAGAKYKLNNWLALQSKIYIHQTEADYVGFGLMLTK